MNSILNVPEEFLDFSINRYPVENNSINFEAFFYNYFKENNQINSEYTYIPIQWTNYLVNNDYGNNIDNLINFCNNQINRTKKYFTIVQYAGGPLVELHNTKIFSMGGTFSTKIPKTSSVIPLPLLYEPFLAPKENKEKQFIGSYIGRSTHKLRTEMVSKLQSNSNFYVQNLDYMDANILEQDADKFKQLISESYFSLCPRGYGPTSFRLYESIKSGTVPVYISDEHFLPYKEEMNWSDFSLILKPRHLNKLAKILNNEISSGGYEKLYSNLQLVKDSYFNFNSMASYVLKKISE